MEHFRDQTCEHSRYEMAIDSIDLSRLPVDANQTPSHIPEPFNRLFLSSLLLLLDLTTGLDALQDVLTVLVELQLGNDDVGWVDADWD